MAFNNAGMFWLAPGQATDITFSWTNDQSPGDDHGAQWCMAHPIPTPQADNWGAVLTLSNFGKEMTYLLTVVPGDGGFYTPGYIYHVTVTNTGTVATSFSIQGGGNV